MKKLSPMGSRVLQEKQQQEAEYERQKEESLLRIMKEYGVAKKRR